MDLWVASRRREVAVACVCGDVQAVSAGDSRWTDAIISAAGAHFVGQGGSGPHLRLHLEAAGFGHGSVVLGAVLVSLFDDHRVRERIGWEYGYADLSGQEFCVARLDDRAGHGLHLRVVPRAWTRAAARQLRREVWGWDELASIQETDPLGVLTDDP